MAKLNRHATISEQTFYRRDRFCREITCRTGTQLVGVRIATFARLLPLLLQIHLVYTTDGLMQRAIGRASAGRESASGHHRAKRLQVALAGTAVLFVIVWPAPVESLIPALPLAATIGVVARIQWACYRKHL